LAREGRRVIGVARSEGPLGELVAEIEGAGGVAQAHPCDLSDSGAVTAMVDRDLETAEKALKQAEELAVGHGVTVQATIADDLPDLRGDASAMRDVLLPLIQTIESLGGG